MKNESNESFVSGLLVGILIAGAILGFVSVTWVKKAGADARRGWVLKPVVVAAVDLPEGQRLTYEMISQRSVPEQFVTDSNVSPGAAPSILNKTVAVPVHAGDPILWSHFLDVKEDGLRECLKKTGGKALSPSPQSAP